MQSFFRFTRFCIGKNIFFNFHALLTTANHNKFREDLFNAGDIGGFCEVNQTLLKEQSEHKSPLQSWLVFCFILLNSRAFLNTIIN